MRLRTLLVPSVLLGRLLMGLFRRRLLSSQFVRLLVGLLTRLMTRLLMRLLGRRALLGLLGLVLAPPVLLSGALALLTSALSLLALVLRELLAAVGSSGVTRLMAGLAAVLEAVATTPGLGRRPLRPAGLLALRLLATLRLLASSGLLAPPWLLASSGLLASLWLLAAGPTTLRLLEPLRNVLPGLALRRGVAPLVSRRAAVSERRVAPSLPLSGRCPSTLSALLTGRVGGDDGLLAPESLFHLSLDLLGASAVTLFAASLLVASALVASVFATLLAASLSVLVVGHL